MSRSAMRVMVVEDHGFQRRMAMRLLSELGIARTCESGDGAGALAQLRAMAARGEPLPDVMLVDLDMPGMDGVELIEHVARERLVGAVMLVSAADPAVLATVQAMSRGAGLRVLGCVEKPLTVAKLAELLALGGDAPGLPPEADPDIPVARIRAALQEGRIRPWFQPQVGIADRKPVGVEALARWERRDGTVVPPRQFVPVLEREGLGGALTEAMLAQGCEIVAGWAERDECLRLSVNVAPATLADPQTADRYHRIVAERGMAPRDVVLELTEGSLLGDTTGSLGVLARLRLKGFGLSVDDFGTGYSSLLQLSQVPFTELKIDRAFVSGAEKLPRKRAMIEASLDLARKLGLSVVAEGVETADEWRLLADLGCEVAQGYLVSRPVPPAELNVWLAQWRRRQC